MPALPLFAQLRRFTLAVLAAAETAADTMTAILTREPEDLDAAELSIAPGSPECPYWKAARNATKSRISNGERTSPMGGMLLTPLVVMP